MSPAEWPGIRVPDYARRNPGEGTFRKVTTYPIKATAAG